MVKFEARGGDVFRHVAPARHAGMGAPFLNLNRNKRNIVLDLKQPDQAEQLREIARHADVFVSNVRPAAMARLGLDDASLRACNPRLVTCCAYGFSERGPYAGRPAFDDIPHSPVLAQKDLPADPPLQQTGMFAPHAHPSEGALRMLGIPTAFSRTPGSVCRPAPALGQHTVEDLAREWAGG
jgi:crotonobetainyl-CoA:carnitine CoA-transferase CaiB-like acyl-CoA transferase